MRLVAVSHVIDGTPLARDVLVGRDDGTPLLRAGVPLTNRYRELLSSVGIHAVYVDDSISEGIVIDTPVDPATQVLAANAVTNMQHLALRALDREDKIDDNDVVDELFDSMSEVVSRILAEVERCGGVALALSDLRSADAYTYQHSIDVAAIGLIVARRHLKTHGWVDYRGNQRFDRIEERLTKLGIGLLLHDIGKMVVPLPILNKPGKLTNAEWELMRTHPRAGLDLLASDRWDPLIKAIVLRHHERWNGSGYPSGQSGLEIHQLARIAAVADVYDAITSARPYAAAQPAAVGVRAILEGASTMYDPQIVESFRQVVAPFPAGTQIRLSDGRDALVVRSAEGNLDRPEIRILNGDDAVEELALVDHPELTIADWPTEF